MVKANKCNTFHEIFFVSKRIKRALKALSHLQAKQGMFLAS